MRAIFLLSLLLFFVSCKKNKRECPEQTYNIECNVSTPDFEFGGYLIDVDHFTIQSNCLEDAQKQASDMSYKYGQWYKICRVLP